MGCDIHLVVEVRKGGQWERAHPAPEDRDPWYVEMAAREPLLLVQAGPALVRTGEHARGRYDVRAERTWYADRNYEVFGELAGVRRDVVPIAAPRGFPADLSRDVKLLLSGLGHEDDIWLEPEGQHSDIHSASWLTLRELAGHVWPESALKWDFGKRFLPALVRLRDREGATDDDVRIVFGFDN